jgi:PST family polysaccharide transporter
MMSVRDAAHIAPAAASLRRTAVSGLVWLLAGSISNRATVLISQLFLAKLLEPEDFGLFGLASTITTVFGVLTEVGIEQILQQRRARMRLWTTQAFWISLILASIVTAVIAAAAPVFAAFYHAPQIVMLVWISTASLPLSALATVPRAYLQAAMRFRFLSSYNAADLAALQCATILLAWTGCGVLSFVLPLPVLALVRTAWFWCVAPVPIRTLRYCRHWRIMLSRGSMILGSRITNVLIDQGDYATLGLLATTHNVGLYYFAFRISAQPMRMLAGNLSAVLFPMLNAIKGEHTLQRDMALKAAEVLGALTVPVCFLQAAVAGPALTLLFGTRWAEAIPLLQLLSLGLPFDAISWPAGALLAVRGKFGKIFFYQIIFTPVFY